MSTEESPTALLMRLQARGAVRPVEADASAYADAACEWCDNRGLELVESPRAGRRVVMLGVCIRCGHAVEL